VLDSKQLRVLKFIIPLSPFLRYDAFVEAAASCKQLLRFISVLLLSVIRNDRSGIGIILDYT